MRDDSDSMAFLKLKIFSRRAPKFNKHVFDCDFLFIISRSFVSELSAEGFFRKNAGILRQTAVRRMIPRSRRGAWLGSEGVTVRSSEGA